MVWVRLDDHFDENPKILRVGPLGIALWVTGLAYCNRNLTDGFIPSSIAIRMLSIEFDHPKDGGACSVLVGGALDGEDANLQVGTVPNRYYVPNMLVAAGLWDLVDGGYMVHDYEKFQPTKAEVEADRAAKQAAGRAGGQARAKALATALAQAESKQDASSRPAISQAKSKPVPVPVPSSSNEEECAPEARPTPRRKISDADIASWSEEYPQVDIPAMVADYLNWSGSSKHTDKVLGFRNQLREEWRREKFRKNVNGRQIYREEGIFAGSD